jgi:hypothetical protein
MAMRVRWGVSLCGGVPAASMPVCDIAVSLLLLWSESQASRARWRTLSACATGALTAGDRAPAGPQAGPPTCIPTTTPPSGDQKGETQLLRKPAYRSRCMCKPRNTGNLKNVQDAVLDTKGMAITSKSLCTLANHQKTHIACNTLRR